MLELMRVVARRAVRGERSQPARRSRPFLRRRRGPLGTSPHRFDHLTSPLRSREPRPSDMSVEAAHAIRWPAYAKTGAISLLATLGFSRPLHRFLISLPMAGRLLIFFASRINLRCLSTPTSAGDCDQHTGETRRSEKTFETLHIHVLLKLAEKNLIPLGGMMPRCDAAKVQPRSMGEGERFSVPQRQTLKGLACGPNLPNA